MDELIEICQNQYILPKNAICPYCSAKNRTKLMSESFRDLDNATMKIWASCMSCDKEFQLQGKVITLKAAIPAHIECPCGRHFMFYLKRDFDNVMFTYFFSAPYIYCVNCNRRVLIKTPTTPFRYLMLLTWLKIRKFVNRQRLLNQVQQ